MHEDERGVENAFVEESILGVTTLEQEAQLHLQPTAKGTSSPSFGSRVWPKALSGTDRPMTGNSANDIIR